MSVSNKLRIYDGRTSDMPLNDDGLEQGKSAGLKISRKISHIDQVITSSTQRIQQTAEIVLVAFEGAALTIEIDEAFLERNCGKYEGHPLKELEPNNKKDKQVSASIRSDGIRC